MTSMQSAPAKPTCEGRCEREGGWLEVGEGGGGEGEGKAAGKAVGRGGRQRARGAEGRGRSLGLSDPALPAPTARALSEVRSLTSHSHPCEIIWPLTLTCELQ